MEETRFTSLNQQEKEQINDVGESFIKTNHEKKRYPMTKFQIIKNLVVVSLGFLFLFTAFMSLSNLQSTLNKEEGIGVGGLSVIYGALIISCLFFPTFIIANIGCKWTIAFSMLCYVLYMAANFYAIWALIAPSAVILGFGAAPLWSAKCTYLTNTAIWYSEMTGTTKDDAISRFFGFFFMTFQTGQIWGNLVASIVFSQRSVNSTLDVSDLSTCGANFDPRVKINNTNLDRPDIVKVYTVCGVFVGLALVAFFFIAIFLDQIPLDTNKSRKKNNKISFDLLLATFKHWKDSRSQQLITILTIYSGIEQAFLAGEFTKAYISCALGIWKVGYVLICYGTVNAICSVTVGRLVQFVGQVPFFILALVVHGGMQITLLLWTPDPQNEYLFYIFAALWGLGDAIIQAQINALYGYLFIDNTEAGFSNYRLWESTGFILAFAYSDFLGTRTKLYICLSTLVIGMIGYAFVEIIDRRKKAKTIKTKF